MGSALETYAKAFEDGTAKPSSTFISMLSDANEYADSCVPALYSKSLLYLVSRALEPDHKTPVLGLQKASVGDDKDDTFKSDLFQIVADWKVKSGGIKLDPPIRNRWCRSAGRAGWSKPCRQIGSFDNNLDVVNLAFKRIWAPARRASDRSEGLLGPSPPSRVISLGCSNQDVALRSVMIHRPISQQFLASEHLSPRRRRGLTTGWGSYALLRERDFDGDLGAPP